MDASSKPLVTLHPVSIPVPETDRGLKGREMVTALRAHARRAVKASAQISGLAVAALLKDTQGAPKPSGGIFWSLTHKQTRVAAVVSRQPVGIDIEAITECNPALYRRIADAGEWALVPDQCPEAFFRFWTAKEAVLKAVGKGLTGLDHCRIQKIVDDSHMVLTYDGTTWRVIQHRTDDGHMLAVTQSADTVQWHIYDSCPTHI